MKNRLNKTFLASFLLMIFCPFMQFPFLLGKDATVQEPQPVDDNLQASNNQPQKDKPPQQIVDIFSTQDSSDTSNQQTQPNVTLNAPGSEPLLTPVDNIQGTQAIKEKNDDDKFEEEKADIYLNFENATLASVVNYLSEQKKLNIVPHKDLNNIKVSLTTRNPLTLSRAWNVLHTLLEMNGFATLEAGNLYRIVPIKQASQEPLPVYSSGTRTEPEDLPDSDQIVRYIYFFKNVKASQMVGILSRILSENSVKEIKDLEACIITDNCLSIKAAMKIIKSFDTGGMKQSIKILRLKHADADHISRLMGQIMGDKKDQQNLRLFSTEEKFESSFFASSTKIVPDLSRNSLIFLGIEKNIDKIITFIRSQYEKGPEEAQTRIHVKEIKYVSAVKIKGILDSMLKAPRDQKKPIVGEFKFFEDVIVAAETPQKDNPRGSGNRLVVSCDRDDWKRIEEFIDKLDKPMPQIAMEVLVVDVTTSFIRQLGAQLRNKPGFFGKTFNAETTNLAASSSTLPLDQINEIGVVDGINPATWVTLGNADAGNVWGVVKAAISTNNANVISQPFLIVNSGEEANLSVKQTLRVAGKINDPSKAGGARTRDQEDFPAATSVKITPRMNSEGLITLAIDVRINEIQQTLSSTGQPKTNDRHIATQSTMGNGQVLTLGGLTLSSVTDTENETPFFSRIPLIGNFFKSKTKNETKNDLFVFIRPSVIKPVFEGKPDDYTELKLAYAKYQIMGVDTYAKNKDPIQRWFFKPGNHSVKQTLVDAAEGRYRPIDDYTEGKKIPKSVQISRDPFYKSGEELEKAREKEEKEKQRRKKIITDMKKRPQDKSLFAKKDKEENEKVNKLEALHSFAMGPKR